MFIEKLEKLLKERHLTMNKLAQGIGYSQSATSQWKKGRMPQIDVLKKICEYLNVSADYLLDLEDADPPPVLNDEELQLINNFRLCDSGTRENIHTLASAGAEKAKQKEISLNLKNIG